MRFTSKLSLLLEFKSSQNAIFRNLKRCANPDMAFSYFYFLLENSTAKSTIFELIKSFSVIGELLFGIFSQSNTLSLILITNSEYIFWLIENRTLGYDKSYTDYYEEITELVKHAKSLEQQEYILRKYRKKEYLRIGAREIINACNFVSTMKEISCLAEALIQASVDIAYENLRKNNPQADKNICVIGMGKLGTNELNFSSDIDLMFVHNDDGSKDYYCRFAADIVSILNNNKHGGFVFRVDTRLRPGGSSYPLSLSLSEYENYYSTFGRNWERMALLKAKPVAGDMELGRQFVNLVQPFIYKKSIDLNYIENIRSLMFRIKKHSKHTDFYLINPDKMDIKKGVGGIREVEFIIHYFQLVYGGEDIDLRYLGSVECLKMLKAKKYISVEDADSLLDGYIFLRRTEHKIQLLDEMQTQMLPKTEKELAFLARRMDMNTESFIDRYNSITEKIHSIFVSIFVENSNVPVFGLEEDIDGFLVEKGIKNSSRIARIIVDISKKCIAKDIDKKVISSLLNYTVNFFKDEYLLSGALNGMDVIDPVYLPFLYKNHLLLDIFLKTLSIGYAEKIHKNPALMEEFFSVGEPIEINEITKEEKERLEFAIMLKFLSGHFNIKLFETMTKFADELIKLTISAFDIKDTAVVGYGKIGIKELFIGSDLDLIILSKSRAAMLITPVQKAINKIKKIFEVDLRLRPFGDKGLIVVNVDYLNSYFSKYARGWEKLAAQKVRVIYSDFGSEEICSVYRKFLDTKFMTKKDIYSMKKSIEKTKGDNSSIKSFSGGLTDIEFIAQYICFEHRCVSMGDSPLKLLEKIMQRNFFDRSKIDILKNGYIFYTKILSFIRIANLRGGLKNENVDILKFLTGDKYMDKKIKAFREHTASIFNEVFCDNIGE